MGIITSQIMENNWDLKLFWVNPQLQSTVLIRRSPVLPSNVTMIPEPDICFLILLATNMALYCSRKHLFLLISHIQRLLEFRTNNLLPVLHLWKHLLHKLFNRLLPSVNFHWFSIFIILAAYYFITIAAASVLLIFVSIRFSTTWLTSFTLGARGFSLAVSGFGQVLKSDLREASGPEHHPSW